MLGAKQTACEDLTRHSTSVSQPPRLFRNEPKYSNNSYIITGQGPSGYLNLFRKHQVGLFYSSKDNEMNFTT